MSRSHKALGVLMVTMFGLWGCARGPATPSATENDRSKALEAKAIKLDEELRSALAIKDQLRRKLNDAEDANIRLQQDIDQLKLAGDELQAQLKTRTQERDQLQVQYEGFRRNIRDLLGQAEAAMQPGKPTPAKLASRRVDGPTSSKDGN